MLNIFIQNERVFFFILEVATCVLKLQGKLIFWNG